MQEYQIDTPSKDEKQAFKDYIDNIEIQIRVPFIKNRIEEKKIKEDQQEEIQDLVQEIGNKEEQLQGLCELGQYLIEKQDQSEHDFGEQIKQLQNTIIDQETDSEFQKQSIQQYRKLYNDSIEKIDELQQDLMKMNDQCDEYKHTAKVQEGQIKQLQQIQYEQQENDSKQAELESKMLKEEIIQLNKELEEQKSITKTIKQQYNESENNIMKQTELIEIQNQEIKEEQFKNQKLKFQMGEKENMIGDLEKHQAEQKEQVQELNRKIFDLKMQIDHIQSEKNQGVSQNLNQNNKKSQVLYTENNEMLQTQESQQDQFSQQIYGNLLSEIEDLGVMGEDPKGSFTRNNLFVNENENRGQSGSGTNNEDLLKGQEQVQPNFTKKSQKTPTIVINEEQNLNTSQHLEEEIQIQTPQQQNNHYQKIHDLINRNKKQNEQQQQGNSNSNNMQQNGDGGSAQKEKQLERQLSSQEQSAAKKKQIAMGRRRDPYEEFFSLTCQCVKLNSPYMDDIIDMDSSQYYKQVRELCIPYHRWYNFVQEKLLEQRDILLKNEL